MAPARYDVFISYRRADAALVGPLRDELQRLGYRVFFDTVSIEGGDDWKVRLQRAVAGSRALVLCWSEHASQSPIVTFEYSCARALNKPVVPWLLDHTPLPVMLDHLNGIHNPDALQVAAALRPRLGRTLTARRRLQAAFAGLMAAAVAFALWFAFKPPPPPPPWEFSGTVVDRESSVPLPGVEVDVTLDPNKPEITTHTDSQGKFKLSLPQPQPDHVMVRLTKDGYGFDNEPFTTSHPLRYDLEKSK
jgi:hypothetical protein